MSKQNPTFFDWLANCLSALISFAVIGAIGVIGLGAVYELGPIAGIIACLLGMVMLLGTIETFGPKR